MAEFSDGVVNGQGPRSEEQSSSDCYWPRSVYTTVHRVFAPEWGATTTDRAIMACLIVASDYATGTVTISHSQIGKRTSLRRETVCRRVAWLTSDREGPFVLRAEARRTAGGYRAANTYQILVRRGWRESMRAVPALAEITPGVIEERRDRDSRAQQDPNRSKSSPNKKGGDRGSHGFRRIRANRGRP